MYKCATNTLLEGVSHADLSRQQTPSNASMEYLVEILPSLYFCCVCTLALEEIETNGTRVPGIIANSSKGERCLAVSLGYTVPGTCYTSVCTSKCAMWAEIYTHCYVCFACLHCTQQQTRAMLEGSAHSSCSRDSTNTRSLPYLSPFVGLSCRDRTEPEH